MDKRILLASPRGFCFGVGRAIEMLNSVIERESGPVYALHEIVHNTALVNRYKALGVRFVQELEQVPQGGTVVFSAHGVAPSVREQAADRRLNVIDTTCPMVAKIHREAAALKERGCSIILIGKAGHNEVAGIAGEAPAQTQVIQSVADVDRITCVDSAHIAWLSQTTLNVDDTQRIVERLHEVFPLIQDPPQSDICYATRNRQLAVKSIAGECELFLVAGSANSSNTNRLVEAAREAGAAAALRIDTPEELAGVDFSRVFTVGLSAGVSVEERQLKGVVAYLNQIGYHRAEERIAVVEALPPAAADECSCRPAAPEKRQP